MSIQIDGLNSRQKQLADILWSLDSQEEVNIFIRGLELQDQRDAETITQLMILAARDEVTDTQEARRVIDQFRFQS